MTTLELKPNFYWTGIQHPDLKVFDIIMETEFGTTYNSYLVKGSEKTALFETAKAKFVDEYVEKVSSLTDIRDIDYIIANHTEPDHAGSYYRLLEMNPNVTVVGTATAIKFLKAITNMEFASQAVKDGDTLSLGDKTLTFRVFPNLHWPDTMYTYIPEDKALITCDSFGAHYSFDGILQSEIPDQEGYERALKYYFDNILGPFKDPFLLRAIDAIRALDIDMICPGHGPVLDSDPWKVVDQSYEWASVPNPNDKKTVIIPYVSAYGYTASLCEKITEGIKAAGDIDVRSYDMVEADAAAVQSELLWADGILLGSPTILGEALKPILDLTTSMFPPVHGGKVASAFGAYGWSGEAVPHLVERLRQLRMKVLGDGYRVQFKPSEEQLAEAEKFGKHFGQCVLAGDIVDFVDEAAGDDPSADASGGIKKWRCSVCGWEYEGAEPPEACEICGVGADRFEEV